MVLYFRLLWGMFLSLFHRLQSSNEEHSVTLRVWPTDIDFNGHLTNSRYANMADLARSLMAVDTGLFRWCLGSGWVPIVAATRSRFRRSIPLGARFQIRSKGLFLEGDSIFLQHEFVHRDGVAATVWERLVFLRRGKKLQADEVPVFADFKNPEEHPIVAAMAEIS